LRGVGFGDAEGHRDRAVGDAGQPALLLLVRAVTGDDRAVDGGGDDHHQQTAAGRVELLADERELVHAGTATAVLLGEVEAEESGLARLVPQLGERFAVAGAGRGVLVAVALAEFGDSLAQRLLLLGLGEVHLLSPPR
jgi:hypothetical protein